MCCVHRAGSCGCFAPLPLVEDEDGHGDGDGRITLARCIDDLFAALTLLGILSSAALFILGVHLYRLSEDPGVLPAQITAAVVTLFVEVLPLTIPALVMHVVTRFRRWRMGVSDYYMSAREVSYLTQRLYLVDVFTYLIGTGVLLTTVILWVKLPYPRLTGGTVLSLDARCGAGEADSAADTTDSLAAMTPRLACREGVASFLLLCVQLGLILIELLVDMLVFALPAQSMFKVYIDFYSLAQQLQALVTLFGMYIVCLYLYD
ncbi:hypothetical protein KEM52_000666 [Ascosphaera acerosa]|nr:hypothetical protein KEM52_000666 [Ascosphaera acerosa]